MIPNSKIPNSKIPNSKIPADKPGKVQFAKMLTGMTYGDIMELADYLSGSEVELKDRTTGVSHHGKIQAREIADWLYSNAEYILHDESEKVKLATPEPKIRINVL